MVHKCDVVQITGRIQTRTYQDANGSHHKRTEILVDKWYHLMPKQETPKVVDRETGDVSALEDLDV
ncbi:single-stranded DNA-binding protein [Streptococcus hyointestinalis]|uniref:single-stranded DNA-binding protein n=1 Tax=Streptococcus hyointestinalis TaxID=1337 RepID=UPI003CFC4B38